MIMTAKFSFQCPAVRMFVDMRLETVSKPQISFNGKAQTD